MKKVLIILGLTLIAFNNAKAQGVDIGVTGGIMHTNADISLSAIGISIFDIDAVNKTGFYIGLIADIAATEKFHIQPELTYGSAGDLSFIYLPLMAKYYVADKFHVMAGPQITFSSNLGDIKDALETLDDITGANADLDDLLKSTAIDLGFGAGYDITDKIRVHARYAVPLTDIYDGPAGGSLDIKNSTFQVGAAYMF
ncbi:MAG: porin family protein [Bacteroidota bacterium]